jgi:hypothetical protein
MDPVYFTTMSDGLDRLMIIILTNRLKRNAGTAASTDGQSAFADGPVACEQRGRVTVVILGQRRPSAEA